MSFMDVTGGGPLSFSADAARVAAQNNSFNQSMGYAAAQNNAALANTNPYNLNLGPTPPGYGKVNLPYLSGSFGPAAAPGTYSPGSGLSSFSGSSLTQEDRLKALYPNAFKSGGGIGSDAARAPNQPAIQQSVAPPYQPPTSFDQRFNTSGMPPMITAGQPAQPSQSTPQTEYPPFNAGGGGQADRLRALYPDAFKTGSPYGKLFPGPASPSGTVAQGPNLLPATPNWTDAQRAQGTDQARNALADQIFRNGTGASNQKLYTGNWYGANTNPAAGMSPGMGGFNNPNFNNMQFNPPGQSAVPSWESIFGQQAGG